MTHSPAATGQSSSAFVGIDLGTSSVKVVAVDGGGTVLARAGASYPITSAADGFAEQDPEEWWKAVTTALPRVTAEVGAAGRHVAAISVTGQMHGLVLLDDRGAPVRDAVIWPDRRSHQEVAHLVQGLGEKEIHRITGMPPSVGLLGPSLSWVAAHEPTTYARARTAVLPKDYVRFRLTGQLLTEPSDACGTLLFDVVERAWSPLLVSASNLRPELLPTVVDSVDPAGAVHRKAAAVTGLSTGVPVAAGGSDQATAALALGLKRSGQTAVALSSGGTVLQRATTPRVDIPPAVHLLCDAERAWLLMGATLSVGLAVGWLAQLLHGDPSGSREVVAAAAAASPGADGLLFLPYLAGERTPHLDPRARGVFLGLSREHSSRHLARAVLEGVAMAVRDCLNAVVEAGSSPHGVVLCGGGAQDATWRQVIADVLGLPVLVTPYEEQSAVGAAVLAARSVGQHITLAPSRGQTTEPSPALSALYADRYEIFVETFRATRHLVGRLRDH